MDEPTKIFVVSPEIASDIEAMIVMLCIEQGTPVENMRVMASDFVPQNTMYILPGEPELPIREDYQYEWDHTTKRPGQPSRYDWFGRYHYDPSFGLSSIASAALDGGDTSPSSLSPPSSIFASVWRRLTDRLRNLLP